jgi:hypothetical protein
MPLLIELVFSPSVPYTKTDKSTGVIDLRDSAVTVLHRWFDEVYNYPFVQQPMAVNAVLWMKGSVRDTFVLARWCQPNVEVPFRIPPHRIPYEVDRATACRICLLNGRTLPNYFVAGTSGPRSLRADEVAEARRTIGALILKFKAKATEYPKFRSVLIVATDRDGSSEGDRVGATVFSGREAMRLIDRPKHTTQWFLDDDLDRGRKACESYWKLAQATVDCLAELGVLHPFDIPPNEIDSCYFEGLKGYYAAEWTWFVHELARQPRPGSLLRSHESANVEHQALKEGGRCRTLSVGTFEASALALEWVLGGLQSGPPAGTIDPAAGTSTPPGTPPENAREAKGTPLDPNGLNDTDWTILETLFDCGAKDRRERTTLKSLAARWKIGNPDSHHIKAAIKKLKGLPIPLIGTVTGPSGGIWLTEAGVKLCAERRNSA